MTTIDPKTARAIAELGRAAARHAGIPDDVVITMTICADRENDWPDLVDDEEGEKDDVAPARTI